MTLNKNRIMVAPDGGWGYVICAASTIIFVVLTTFQPCFGVIYKDFMIDTHMGSTSLTLLNGISAITMSLSSYFIGALLKLVSLRKLCLIASFSFNAGLLMQIWMKTQLEFFIYQGVLLGFAMGILYPLTCKILNDYFVKKRLFAISLTQTITALVAIISPMFVKWAMETVGFRGMIMLQLGVSLNAFLATALMQPVEWHMKTEEREDNPEESKHLTEKPLTTLETSLEMNEGLKEHKYDLIINDKEKDITIKSDQSWMAKLSDMLDLSLYKDVHMMLTLIAMSGTMFCEMNYILMLPQSLYEIHWNEGAVAWAISLYNIGDLTTRVLSIVFNKVASKFSNRSIFIAAIMLSVVSRVGMLLFAGDTVKMSFMLLIGLFRTPLVTLGPLVLADCVDQSKFASAFGIFLLMMGVISLAFGPVIGIIRDMFDSYSITFFILNGIFVAIVIVWCTEIYFYNRNSRHKKEVESKKIGKIYTVVLVIISALI